MKKYYYKLLNYNDMKQHYLPTGLILTILTILTFIFTGFANGQTVSILGPATPSGDWDTDINMIQNGEDPNLWELEITLTDSTFKFRQDGNWTINWGGSTFPAGTAIPDGPNIEASAGNYYVTFNTMSLIYAFTTISNGHVGIGTYMPAEALDVNGNIKFSGELKPEGMSGATGQVLQSNGDGTMQWAAVASSTGGGSIGYGTWGDCEMSNFSDYFPIIEPGAFGGGEDKFASCVAIEGIYTIIGEPYDDQGGTNAGAASIYKLNTQTGQWLFQAKLLDPDPANADYFGFSVAISGDFVIVGAVLDDDAAGFDQGSVSIFKRNPATEAWEIQGSKIFNTSPAQSDNFGWSVSISGDYAIVGTPNDDDSYGSDQGTALVLKRNESTGIWEPQGSKLVLPGGSAGDSFGSSVSISGDYAMVGANGDDGSLTNMGSVQFFKRNNSSGIWEPQGPSIMDPTGTLNARFGTSVSVSGNFAIAGSPFKDLGSGSAGSASFLKRNEDTELWEFFGTEKINTNSQLNDWFGGQVHIAGNYAIVGCKWDDEDYTDQGSATIFVNAGGNWQKVQKVLDPAGEANDNFGTSCSIDGDSKRFVIGAPSANYYQGKAVFGKFE
jgi:hypothetical protein